MRNLILIDANNLAMRAAFAFSLSVVKEISLEAHPDEEPLVFPTGVLHGFFKSIVMLRRFYPHYYMVIAWDGGYAQRLEITKTAVANRIIPETYKENRRHQAPSREIEAFIKQKPILRAAIQSTNIPQVLVKDEEADDVIASYVRQLSPQCDDILLCTNDRDYFQLLQPNVRIYRNDTIMDMNAFIAEFGITPTQWLDIAAFQGDSGDNIFGVPGWGEKTSLEKIKLHGSAEKVLKVFHEEFDPLREKFPDLNGEEIAQLQNLKSPTGKPKYPDVHEKLPFTGVALALENKKIKKPKSTVLALMFEERVRLAKQLKTMYSDLSIPLLPGWDGSPSWNRGLKDQFLQFCDKYKLAEVSKDADTICAVQP